MTLKAVSVSAGGGSGSGTVTSVAFQGDGVVLSSTPSTPVTSSGYVTASLASAPAYSVLANATASSAAPTYTTSPTISGSFTANRFVSTVSTGTAPFTVTSTTNVPNLNASSLSGATFASPGSIGSTTAGSGAFTTLSASSTVSGTGFSTYLASPPAIGGTAAAAGTFTSLTATTSVTSPTITTSAATVTTMNGGPLAGFRNRTINGNMAIDQRGEGTTYTITTASSLYTVDRFYVTTTGASVTGSRVSGNGDQYAFQLNGATGITGLAFGQRYESSTVYDLASTNATFSVVLSNSVLTTVNWAAYYPGATDNWSTSRTLISSGSFTVTSTPTRYSTTISLPSNVTTGLNIELSVGAQTSGTWTITDWQLEEGSIATPFERRPFTIELLAASRYYEAMTNYGNASGPAGNVWFAWSGNTTSASNYYPFYNFRARKFAIPTITGQLVASSGFATTNTMTVNSSSLYDVVYTITANSTVSGGFAVMEGTYTSEL